MTEQYEWIEVGTRRVPERYRDRFLAHLRGEQTNGADRCNSEGEIPAWRAPNGTFPFSPGYDLRTIVDEYHIAPVTQVSHNMAWLAHDTTGEPGYFGDYSGTYTIYGVRTRRQTMYFIGGVDIYPVLIETLPEGEQHAFIEEAA